VSDAPNQRSDDFILMHNYLWARQFPDTTTDWEKRLLNAHCFGMAAPQGPGGGVMRASSSQRRRYGI
jgi:hypothetical protein